VLDTQSSQQYSILLANNVYTQVCADIYQGINDAQGNYRVYPCSEQLNVTPHQNYFEVPFEEDNGVVVDVVGMFTAEPTPKLYNERM
jgi:hypothetical protein